MNVGRVVEHLHPAMLSGANPVAIISNHLNLAVRLALHSKASGKGAHAYQYTRTPERVDITANLVRNMTM